MNETELIKYKDLVKEDQINTDKFSEFIADIDFKLKEAWAQRKSNLIYDFDEYFKLGYKKPAADLLRQKGYAFRIITQATDYTDINTGLAFTKQCILVDLTAPVPEEE